MKQLISILFLVFAFHILVSLAFIVSPSFLKGTRFARIYKAYLLPGPFFRDDTVTTTYLVSVSWKKDGQWSEPIDPLKEGFHEYYKSFDPADLYKSRDLRTFYQDLLIKPALKGDKKSFNASAWFLLNKYYPPDADSVQILATRKYVAEFNIRIDTLMLSR